jgi:hypothetical protein
MFSLGRISLPRLGVSFSLAVTGVHLHAQDLANGWGPTALEVSKLPPYCQQWFQKKVLPPNCDGVHHLCAGKVLTHRSLDFSVPKPERKRIFRAANTEVDYIFSRPNAQCGMMDEARAAQNQLRSLAPLFK